MGMAHFIEVFHPLILEDEDLSDFEGQGEGMVLVEKLTLLYVSFSFRLAYQEGTP